MSNQARQPKGRKDGGEFAPGGNHMGDAGLPPTAGGDRDGGFGRIAGRGKAEDGQYWGRRDVLADGWDIDRSAEYATPGDMGERYVRPALGDYAGRFDVDGITGDIGAWDPETNLMGVRRMFVGTPDNPSPAAWNLTLQAHDMDATQEERGRAAKALGRLGDADRRARFEALPPEERHAATLRAGERTVGPYMRPRVGDDGEPEVHVPSGSVLAHEMDAHETAFRREGWEKTASGWTSKDTGTDPVATLMHADGGTREDTLVHLAWTGRALHGWEDDED